MADLRRFSKSFLTEFIELYRSLPSVWNVKSREYSNRDNKNRSYQLLIDKLKTVEENADREMVIKKINSLRTSYRKEKKKVNDSRKSGNGTDEVYNSALWYYDLLQFVDDQDTPLEPVSNFDEQLEDICSPYSDPVGTPCSELESPASSSSTPKLPPRHDRSTKKKRDEELDIIISSVGKRICEDKVDDCDIFGKNVASELRSVPNDQRIYLKKLINDAIFEAHLSNLNRDSSIYTRSNTRAIEQNVNHFPDPIQVTSHSQPTYTPLTSLANFSKNIVPRPAPTLSLVSPNSQEVSSYSHFTPYM